MLKVLLVEDENLIRRGLQYKMDWTEVNCVVVGEAATGQEGLTQIKALRPDIVITDIRMTMRSRPSGWVWRNTCSSLWT